jgi:two-component system OmpR family response regulator
VREETVMRVLLVEDDEALGIAVRDQIAADGHAVDWFTRLGDAAGSMRVVVYDLVLLDLTLRDGNGLDFLRARRAGGDTTPLVILTARDRISDRIAGLNAGADDYLVKPFDLSELSARVAAVSRRYAGNPNPVLRVGKLGVDRIARTVERDGRGIDLTAREWALLDALLQRAGAVLSKAQIEDRLYAFDSEIESNTIEVLVSRLRKKLGADVIETVRGMGYRLSRS